VMSLTGFALENGTHSYDHAIAAIDGNICRCTGYKSIERAARIISDQLQAEQPAGLDGLIEKGFVPAYFAGIQERLTVLKKDLLAEVQVSAGNPVFAIGGGTDLMVQKPEAIKHAALHPLFDRETLNSITWADRKLHVGASVTVTQFTENERIKATFPDLHKTIKLVSSTPIRNMATMAGNFVNASPIGDMSIFFLALDSTLTLLTATGDRREVPLKTFFKAYKKTELQPREMIERISFTPPAPGTFFNFEKVCKRTHLDIASVNTACQMNLAPDGTIAEIHLSAGGVWPFPKYLEQTCAFLKGKKPTPELWAAAEPVLQSDIAPISDARGSEAYKRLLLSKLFQAHYIESHDQA
jgi:xanthine dehydrogenase small subunit